MLWKYIHDSLLLKDNGTKYMYCTVFKNTYVHIIEKI